MARVPARIHQTGVSLTNQDGTSAEVVTTTNGGLITHQEPRVLSMAHPQTSNDLGDSNRNSFFGQDYPQPVMHRTGAKTLASSRCSNFEAAFGAYNAGHAGAAAASALIGATGIYRNTWDLGIKDLVARSFTMVELGDKNNTDADLNETLLNNVLTSFSLSGTRGGAISYSMNVLHGGNVAATGSPPTIVDRSQRWYSFGKHVFLNTASGGNGYATPTTFVTAPSKAQQETDSFLINPDGDYIDDLHSFTLTLNIAYDVAASMVPGGNDYVPTSIDYMITDQSAQLDLTFVHGSAQVKTLRGEYKAPDSTSRGWELVLVHDSALASGAYAGLATAFHDMVYIDNSWSESTTGGNKYVSMSLRPVDTSSIPAAKMAATINSSVALGS
jgi:hypothetical protein